MPNLADLLERESRTVDLQPGDFDRLVRRRDRKRRNQRIAAGVVGIAVFVAAVWIVTSGLPFDRSTPAVPGLETGPTQTGPPPPRASAPATVVRTGTCGDSAWRLEDRPLGDRFKVWFEVHRSPVGHSWRIVIRRLVGIYDPPVVVFRGTRVAAEDGEVMVHLRVWDTPQGDYVRVKATDRQTGQFCRVVTEIW
jgi:hypothetical protein